MKEQQNEYSIATASQLDPATAYSVAWPISEHVDVSSRAGFEGNIELWPQRFGPSIELKFEMLTSNTKKKIKSVHQSPVGLSRGKPLASQLQAAVLLPRLNTSLKSLENIRDQVGDVPAVLFRETPLSYMRESSFSYKQIQTDPETAAAWSISSGLDSATAARIYVEKAKLNLFDGIVIDTHHIRRRNSKTLERNPLSDWEKSIPELLPYCKEVHVGVGRADYPDMAEKANLELRDLLNGGRNSSEIVRMLRFIADSGWAGIVVVELRPSAIKKDYKKKIFLSPNDLVDSYQRIRITLDNIFDRAI